MMANDRSFFHEGRRGHHSGGGARAGLTAGGALIIMGGGFLLAKMGQLGALNPWHVWPMILVWAGLLKILIGRSAQHAFEGVIAIGVGGALQANYLGLIHLEWGMIWPALLILAGLVVFFSTWRHGQRHRKRQTRPSSESYLSGEVIFGGRQERIDSKEFEGGDISCVMGGYEIDLREAALKDGEATIHARVVMGGVEIKVPDHWVIVLQGNPVMGAFENKTRFSPSADASDAPKLIVDGSAVMGGVEVKN